MKYSVLLPTRNGSQLLRNCIASVLDEPYTDMELVVVNNASTDDTHEVISEFTGDSRLKYVKTDEYVPVTNNWNKALQISEGEYFVMIGDDDCLLPGYFAKLDQILDHYHNPDCVIYDAYLYVFPHSVSADEGSYYNDSSFTPGSLYPGLVPEETRFAIVRDIVRYRRQYVTNMQSALVARRVADRIPGGIFQPPFPDLYARLALLLEAKILVGVPVPLAVVGVSPKSHGHYFYNRRRSEGMTYLGIEADFTGRLPGSTHNDCVLLTLERLESQFTTLLDGVQVNRGGYVRTQVLEWLTELRTGVISSGELIGRFRELRPSDWPSLAVSLVDKRSLGRLMSVVRPKAKGGVTLQAIAGAEFTSLPEIRDIREFVQWVEGRSALNSRRASQ